MKEVKNLELNFKINYWFLFFIIFKLIYAFSFFIFEIYSVIEYKINFLLSWCFIIMSFCFLLMTIYSFIHLITNDFVILLSYKMLKKIMIMLNLLSFVAIICLIISLIFLNAFLLINAHFPVFEFKIFVILVIISIIYSYLFFQIRGIIQKYRYNKLTLNPTLIYSSLFSKLDFYYYANKDINNKFFYNKNLDENNNQIKILTNTNFVLSNFELERIYKIYDGSLFNKFERISKSWFNPLNVFLWSSLISLFSIIVSYVIINKDYNDLTEISTLLFIFVFFLLAFSLSFNVFFNTNNYQIIKEDNEDDLKDLIDAIIIQVNDKTLLEDKNIVFILGILRKIILYIGAGYKKFDFLLKTTKNLKIINKNKSLFFDLNIIDKELVVKCNYKIND